MVKDLTTSPTSTITDVSHDSYANSLFQISNQLRAPNGRIFFPEAVNYLMYYDPADEMVHQLGPVVDTAHGRIDDIFYNAVFGPDENLYMGTQSQQLPMVCSVDPTTTPPTIRIIEHVGRTRISSLSYAYYLQADTVTAKKTLYAAVGKDPWELVAIDITTGDQTVLKSIPATGNIAFVTGREDAKYGIVCKCDTDLHNPDNVTTQLWCVDLTTYEYTAGYDPKHLPFTTRNVTPVSNPIISPPQVDYSSGIGLVRWRPNGSTGPWKSVPYKVNNAAPVKIESLLPLPDGTVLGNVEQYLGFFHYDPAKSSTTWYGEWAGGLSGGPRLVVNGTVWMAGYPNGTLYSYDPARPWSPSDPANPVHHGNYAASGMKYADYFA